jgi:hypothetical protein
MILNLKKYRIHLVIHSPVLVIYSQLKGYSYKTKWSFDDSAVYRELYMHLLNGFKFKKGIGFAVSFIALYLSLTSTSTVKDFYDRNVKISHQG